MRAGSIVASVRISLIGIAGAVLLMAVQAGASVGPFTIHSADSGSFLRFQTALQLRLQWEAKDAGAVGHSEDVVTLRVRRLRPVVSGSAWRREFSFRIHLSLAPGSAELMDAYFNYAFSGAMQLRAGQYKVPFTRYRIQSFQRLTLADWSRITKYFGAERQMGLAFHNGYERPPRWAYAVGVFSGVNARAAHGVGLPQAFGLPVANPSDLAEGGAAGEFHPEVCIHAAFNSGGIEVRSDSDEAGGGARFMAAVSGTWDMDPVRYVDLSHRVAAEMLFKYRGLSLAGTGLLAYAEYGRSGDAREAFRGILVQTAYRWRNGLELAVRGAAVNADDRLADEALNRATAIISQTPQAATAALVEAGQTLRERELTVGVNVYLVGDQLKIQTDAGWLRRTRRDGVRTDFTARSQVQLSF